MFVFGLGVGAEEPSLPDETCVAGVGDGVGLEVDIWFSELPLSPLPEVGQENPARQLTRPFTVIAALARFTVAANPNMIAIINIFFI